MEGYGPTQTEWLQELWNENIGFYHVLITRDPGVLYHGALFHLNVVRMYQVAHGSRAYSAGEIFTAIRNLSVSEYAVVSKFLRTD